ncbi:hypothetical protein Malapachy_2024 [Malassezia pachydermatis]|uniref:Uncharacterized protein n=1 Tax=Malassezia pachydermatis TaxID=77020 RepID=A0A0M9VNQ6_9BASI|nr:hypothetical protein Malapachy_2024 [Malassezia pachydermatis]KOS13615.1 hypothetical protein Malapachy_2024 [Malassezia pachydermatis]
MPSEKRSSFSMPSLLSLVCVALLMAGQVTNVAAAPVAMQDAGVAAPLAHRALDAGAADAHAMAHDRRGAMMHHHQGMRKMHRREPTWAPFTGTILVPESDIPVSTDTVTTTKTKKGKKSTVTQYKTSTTHVTETVSATPTHWTSTATLAATWPRLRWQAMARRWS